MPRTKRPDVVSFSLKIPCDVYEPVQADAERNDRSIAGEVIHRLRLSNIPAKRTKRHALQPVD